MTAQLATVDGWVVAAGASHSPDRIPPDAVEAAVPGALQVSFPGVHGVAWYWAYLELPTGTDLALRFERVWYRADVWWTASPHTGTTARTVSTCRCRPPAAPCWSRCGW